MSDKPNVIVFGMLSGVASALLQYLVPRKPAEPLVAYVLLVDKHSVKPPTTFLGKDFLALLDERSDIIGYQQANLTMPSVVAQCFEKPTPNGRRYDYIIDITGNVAYDHFAQIQIIQTFNVSMNIARETAKYGVKALIRIQPPWYDHVDVNAKYAEEDEESWKPLGVRGVWWHETLRAVGSIPDLPFVVIRCGWAYGPSLIQAEGCSAITLGLVYKHLGQDLKINWSSKLRKNTIHVSDLAVAVWKAAEWMASTGRSAADTIIGVPLPPTGSPDVSSVPLAIAAGPVIVPVFNCVDGGDTTQHSMVDEIAKVFGIKAAFYEGDMKSFADEAGLGLLEVAEVLNDVHVGEWAKIIHNSTPPVPNTPLSPYAHLHQFEEHGCALNGNKLKQMLSFQPQYPRYDSTSIRQYINWCRQQGIWPETPLYTTQ